MNPKEPSDVNLKLAHEIVDGRSLTLLQASEGLRQLALEVIHQDAVINNLKAELDEYVPFSINRAPEVREMDTSMIRNHLELAVMGSHHRNCRGQHIEIEARSQDDGPYQGHHYRVAYYLTPSFLHDVVHPEDAVDHILGKIRHELLRNITKD